MRQNNTPVYYLKSEAIQPNVYGAIVRPQCEDYDKLATGLDSSVQNEVVQVLHDPTVFPNCIYSLIIYPKSKCFFRNWAARKRKE